MKEVFAPKFEIEKKEEKLDLSLFRKKGNSKTYKGYLIQKMKEARDLENLDVCQLIQHFYKKYLEFEKSEKVKYKSWRGKGEMKYWIKPDSIIFEYSAQRGKDEKPLRLKKEYLKEEINRMIWCLNKLKDESNNKIKSRKLGELYYSGNWDSKVFCKRKDHEAFTHLLNILDHYGMIRYSGGCSTILKEIREIQEILK